MGAIKTEMRVLLVGHSGQLGKCIEREIGSEVNLINFDHKNHKILEISKIREPITSIKPDVILNATAWTDVDGAETEKELAREANAIIPRNLATIASELDIPFYQISTDYVFSGNSSSPWEVNSPTVPRTIYGYTKLEGERLSLENYPEGTRILRTAWLYSSFRGNFAKTMIKLALKNSDNISVVSDQIGQPTSAVDLAKQIYLCLSSNLNPGVYHATNSGVASWNEFAKEIFLLVGADPARVKEIDSSDLEVATPRPQYSVLSHKCWENTGIAPMGHWREALTNQIDNIKDSVMKEGL